MNETLRESFEWMTPEFKIMDSGKNTIRIKGVAMKGDIISRNNRKYVVDELAKSARTWVGKPVTINHDPAKKIGDVKWMEYSELSDALEYVADINKQPYVDMIRNHNTSIRGVSIEANYLHNLCPKCGQRFFTEQDFHSHMHEEHFIKTDPTLEPHGILGQALSLVLSPEEPGYTDTTVELMEMYQKPVLRLLEVVTKTETEKEDYMKKLQGKAATTPVPTVAATVQPHIKESEHTVSGDTTTDEIPAGKCGPNEEWDEDLQRCVTKKLEPPPTETVAKEAEEPTKCADGFHLEGDECVPDKEASEQVECGEGQHWDDEKQVCVPNAPEPGAKVEDSPTYTPPVSTVLEVKLPKMLSLGEPFADYDSFEDCVAKNSDKGDPEAYCGKIKHEAEGETVKENLYEESKSIRETIKANRDVQARRNRSIAEHVNKLNESVAKIATYTATLPNVVNKAFKEVDSNFAKHREEARKLFMELGKASTNMKTLKEYTDKKLGQLATAEMNSAKQLKETIKNITFPEDDVTWKEKLTTLETKLTDIEKLGNTVKEAYEAELAAYKKDLKEFWEPLKGQVDTLEKEKKELEQKVNDKTVTETAEITRRLGNLEDKLDGKFKAHNKELKDSQTTVLEDPLKPDKRGK